MNSILASIANKLYHTEIMIGEKTYNLVKGKYITRPLGKLRVKGKQESVEVYELVATLFEKLDTGMKDMLSHYEKGFESYLKRNFKEALKHFQLALQVVKDDGPSRYFLSRCEEILNKSSK